MIGLMIVTHETVGQANLQLIQHIFGSIPEKIAVVGVRSDDSVEQIHAEVVKNLSSLNYGNGVLILTDIFGATPCNLVRQLLKQDNIILLTGLNAPMLIKALQNFAKFDDVREFAEVVKQAAIAGIMTISNQDEL
ncbi:PTS mannose transporter subunit IIA [Snodgrassella sp. B3882]|uniref:PTS sugar transporter subunit IIA n=1 Tax=Snodgrassella sp. B3882 TaxID=2818037 RepID=UPI00226A2DA4|nr:PTS mannose transporter subunit IIA [Snodgrassella sp. B3882]MCX8745603.1 PTS mannose transporter subunit IIA [Snodgrassella sp. B3882]